MMRRTANTICLTAALLLCLAALPAHALRCGTKLIKREMHETQVIDLCGEPVSTRSLGLAIRHFDRYSRRSSQTYRLENGYATQEVLVTEMLFNFGPQKLMRLIRFEGGRVVSIETAGYGYREKR